MIHIGIFIIMVMIFLFIGTFLLLGITDANTKRDEAIKKLHNMRRTAIYWNDMYENLQREYVALHRRKSGATPSKSSSNSSGPTWRNIMGFSPESKPTKSQIDQRYKALAKVFHPDLGGTEYSMKLLNLAKEKADKSV